MYIQIPRKPREAPEVRMLHFLIRVVRLIPLLLHELEAGHVESGQRLGRRRLRDGRRAELWLIARAPEPDTRPLVRGRN
jgi:hypothetical protein